MSRIRNFVLRFMILVVAFAHPMLVAQNWQSAPTMDREPHHHIAFQNQYLRAFKVEVPPHSATLLHQHPRDYIFVALGDSSLENDVQSKPPAKLELRDGEVRFTKGGFAHIAKNLSARPFRNITVEFLQSVGDLKPPELSQFGPGTGCLFGGVMFPATVKVLYSSDVFSVRDFSLPRKCGMPSHGKGSLVVALSSVVISQASGRAVPLHRGDLLWLSPGDSVVNRHSASARFISLEFEK